MAGKIAAAAAAMDKAKADSSSLALHKKNLFSTIDKMKGAVEKALPSVITPERFVRIVQSAISTNPKLLECSEQSFLGAMMTAAQLGLEPNTPTGQAYLIPRWNSKTQCQDAQFQLGYKGLINLFYRDANAQSLEAHTVYANDTFEYELGLEPKLVHKPAMADRGEPIAYYAVFRTKTGGYGFEVMSKADIDAHANKYSDAVKKGWMSPWKTNYDEMAKKTVIKRVLKYAPISTDFARAVAADETVSKLEPTGNADEYDIIDITNEWEGTDIGEGTEPLEGDRPHQDNA